MSEAIKSGSLPLLPVADIGLDRGPSALPVYRLAQALAPALQQQFPALVFAQSRAGRSLAATIQGITQ